MDENDASIFGMEEKAKGITSDKQTASRTLLDLHFDPAYGGHLSVSSRLRCIASHELELFIRIIYLLISRRELLLVGRHCQY
jgi:hypothetical protein